MGLQTLILHPTVKSFVVTLLSVLLIVPWQAFAQNAAGAAQHFTTIEPPTECDNADFKSAGPEVCGAIMQTMKKFNEFAAKEGIPHSDFAASQGDKRKMVLSRGAEVKLLEECRAGIPGQNI